MKEKERQVRSWAEFHQEQKASNYPKWPNEAMVKVIFGGYAADRPRPQAGWRILDVGCGFGNNLMPFLDLGCSCAGVEIGDDIIAVTSQALQQRGFAADIQVGRNAQLPFADNEFDLLLSINTLHYEDTPKKLDDALAEFRRVLKPGGRLYLSTVGPRHLIHLRAEALGMRRFQIRDFDFRDGEIMSFFESTDDLASALREHFTGGVETGVVTENLMTKSLEFLVALARK